MTIIIIDSGIPAEYISKNNNTIISKCIKEKSNKLYVANNGIDMIGHGTAVLDIIDRNIKNSIIISIKIFKDKSTEADSNALLFALRYIYSEIKCGIINISNGITACDITDELNDICCKLRDKGTVIVSAFDNLGGISFPAALDSVIGVDYSTEVKFGKYIFVKNGVVNIKYGISEQRVKWYNNEKKIVCGNSFLAPYITLLIANYLTINPSADFCEIMKYLEQKSEYIVNYKNDIDEDRIFLINKAVTFPYNKEIDSILRNNDMLNFKVIHAYDSKYLRKIGFKVSDFYIEDIENINWEENFDTFIIGHLDIIENLTGINYSKNIINMCIKYNKNIVSLDEYNLRSFSVKDIKEKINVFFPNNKKLILNTEYMENKLFINNVPVISVLGTSSKQGKFTLQLKLRKFFESNGYKVGQLGTEPTSLLFGFDEMFVMGYNSKINLTSSSNILAINRLIHNISLKKPDIIIVGSQSHTVPLGYNSIDSLPVYQQDLLLGTLPDACLLCINYDDDINYIKRTIKYIEGLCETKVIAIFLSPINNNSKWTKYGLMDEHITSTTDRTKIINKIQKEINMPIYCDNTINSLFDCVLNYFQ